MFQRFTRLPVRRGKIDGETPLDGNAKDIVEFWIDGKALVDPNAYGNDAGVYKYRAGGKPATTLKAFYQPQGAAIHL